MRPGNPSRARITDVVAESEQLNSRSSRRQLTVANDATGILAFRSSAPRTKYVRGKKEFSCGGKNLRAIAELQ